MTIENNSGAKLRLFSGLAIALIVVTALFITLDPLLSCHALHGDERYYIGRALQDVEFYMGVRSAKAVWFSSGNHPFSAETITGLAVFLQGKLVEAPSNPWKTPVSRDLLIAARRSALVVGLLGLGALLLLTLYLDPWLTPIPVLYLLASPGFIDFSMRCMLDIYLASFTTLALVCIVLHILSRSRRWLLLSGFFEGLALGSKTGFDPLVAFLVCSFAILIAEERLRVFVKRWLLYVLTAFASFSVTSTVILLRLEEHINSVLAHHAPRFALENMFSKQPLVATSFENMAKLHYNIFCLQHPTCVFVTAVAVITFTATLLAVLFRCKPICRFAEETRSDRLLHAVILVTAFMALTLLLTSMTFEYGRNYARLTLYECLTTVLCLAHLLKGRKLAVKISSVIITSLFLALALHSYWQSVFSTSYYRDEGWALAAPWLWSKGIAYLIPYTKLINLIPWSSWLLLLSASISLALSISICLLSIPTTIPRLLQGVGRTTEVFESTYSQLYDFLVGIARKIFKTPGHEVPIKAGERAKIEEGLERELREALKSEEEEKVLRRTLPPSLSSVAHSLLEELGEAPTDEALVKSVRKLIEAYEELIGLRSLTLREALARIAEEYGLSISDALEVTKAIEGYIYGNKPLTSKARIKVLQALKKLLQH